MKEKPAPGEKWNAVCSGHPNAPFLNLGWLMGRWGGVRTRHCGAAHHPSPHPARKGKGAGMGWWGWVASGKGHPSGDKTQESQLPEGINSPSLLPGICF